MGGVKETPRQRLISMMYLVLTALLALNVSKDVINAFIVVNDNILQTNMNYANKLHDLYADFEKNYQLNQIKVKPYWEKALEVKKISKEMVEYLNNLRFDLIAATEKVSVDSAKKIQVRDIRKKDTYLVPTHFFMGSSMDGSNGEAAKLKEKINTYHHNMIELANLNNLGKVSLDLSTAGPYYNRDGKEESWETHFFYQTIIAADIAILNKMVSDIYNAEYDVINHLYKSIGHGDFKFDRIEAKVLPKSSYVLHGEEYFAEIIVAAYDTSQSPEVFYQTGVDFLQQTDMEKSVHLPNKPGVISINLPATKEGINTYAGIVRAQTSTGEVNDYHFSGEYVVARPSFTISAKKMNVFYVGVDNPVSISMSGFTNHQLTASISCGQINRDYENKDWIVTLTSGCNEAIVTIYTTINGGQRTLGSKSFRVKKLPDPIAAIAGKNSGSIKREILLTAGVLVPKMPDDFEFDHSFVIKSFTMTLQRGFKVYNLNSKSAYLTDEMTEHINRTNHGQSIVFENIVALDSEGKERNLAPIILTIN